ncbi:sigma-70 family RNA polymerase sigma factor [Novipirellula artificiosorum]|uniref:RNA polymerase sigma-D factor n=1 Tax=Novipirellula artificiosorum TaxID=2528016 RepID=A0A5C6D3Z9_9BACT|nr:sigma-70 family RNA polymerase sigma factor [Novipirellula artificiosorum]TWU31943.1 RNA polymerase sigma-D factor [Novipirellula artificiosorum]
MTDPCPHSDEREGKKTVKASASEPVDVASLIEEGQGLVRSIALSVFRSLPVPIELDDLIAYGQLGLVEAAQKFDPTSQARFTTFAYYRIRGQIYDGVSKMTWTSRARLRRMRFQQIADDVLESEQDEASDRPTPEEDAAWIGRVTERLTVVYLASGRDDETNGPSLRNAVSTEQSPSAALASLEMQQKLQKVVTQLPPDAARLIRSIYFDGYTLTEAAQRAGISKSWASRLHAKSLDQLAKSLRRD